MGVLTFAGRRSGDRAFSLITFHHLGGPFVPCQESEHKCVAKFQAITLPTQNASGGCSIVADAQLNGVGTVTIQWVVTGHEVSDF